MNLKFPLWKNDGESVLALNEIQKEQLHNLIVKVNSGVYRLEDNPCFCHTADKSSDITVTEKDRYGLPCEYVLCQNCGLIRQKKRLDDHSTAEFYRNEYRDLYNGGRESDLDSDYHLQLRRGMAFYSFLEKAIDLSAIKTVFEVGCGAGGVLFPFHQNGKIVSGCDFGEKYLNFGRGKGMNLYSGELDLNRTPPISQNLVILSHVLEHLTHPLETVNNIIEVISLNGYFLVQVPGIFVIPMSYGDPLRYFMNAHIYDFYGYYLKVFFSTLGLDVIYGDEECTFLLRKPLFWKKKTPEELRSVAVWDRELPSWGRKVAAALKEFYLLYENSKL